MSDDYETTVIVPDIKDQEIWKRYFVPFIEAVHKEQARMFKEAFDTNEKESQ